MSKIEIEAFTQQYADDVTKLYRLSYYSTVAIVFRAAQAPFLYITTVVLTVFLKWMCGSMWLPAAIFASFIMSCCIVVSICYFVVYNWERFDGRKFPRKLLTTNRETFLIALDTTRTPSQLLGTVGVQQLSTSRAYLALLVVDKNHRGIGVSKRLLKAAIEHCKNQGFATVIAEVWGLGNVFSVKGMFEKNGFVEIETKYGPSLYFPLMVASFMEKRL